MSEDKKFYTIFYNNGELEIEKFDDKIDAQIYLKLKYNSIKNDIFGEYKFYLFEGKKWNLKKSPLRFEKIGIDGNVEDKIEIQDSDDSVKIVKSKSEVDDGDINENVLIDMIFETNEENNGSEDDNEFRRLDLNIGEGEEGEEEE